MAESTGAILTAMAANGAIAIAKFAGAFLTGSSAMLAEGVHSVVDTANQALLLVGLKRAARPADALHPFGHGREIYFYSFVVALLIFLAGGLASIYEGLHKVFHPAEEQGIDLFGVAIPGYAVNFAILGFSIMVEGYSLFVAVRSMPPSAGSPLSAVRRSKDPSLFVVLAEDTAAVAGLLLAALGVGLSQWLDMPVLDGASSVGIGLILIAVAVFLMIETHGLLIGEAAEPEIVAAIHALAEQEPAVRHVNEVLTQHFGPTDILVTVSLDVADEIAGGEIEAVVDRLDRTLRETFRSIRRVFIEVQSQTSARRARNVAAPKT